MNIRLPINFKDRKASKVMSDMAKGWTLSTDLTLEGSGRLLKGKKSKPVQTNTISALRRYGLIEAKSFAWPMRTFHLTATAKALARNGGRDETRAMDQRREQLNALGAKE